jgi:hypothetical protein
MAVKHQVDLDVLPAGRNDDWIVVPKGHVWFLPWR